MTRTRLANPPSASHLPLRLRKIIGAFMLAMVMLMASAGIAAAEPDIDVTFNELRVYKQDGETMLDYTISKSTWRELRDANIEPRLNIFTPNKSGVFKFRYSIPIVDRKGRVLYNKRDVQLKRHADMVKIELIGYNGAHRIGRLSFGSQCDEHLDVDVERGGTTTGSGGRDRDRDRDRDSDRPSRADVIKACDAHTSYSSELDKCVDAGMDLPFSRAAGRIIEACGEATSYTSGLKACIVQAGQLSGRPVAAIEACDAATSYDSELKSCLKKAVEFNHRSAGAVIAACDAHTSYSSELNGCVDAASALDSDHVAIVNACGDATSYSSEFKRCIQKAAR